jgi:AraC-like DNA-binding protein
MRINDIVFVYHLRDERQIAWHGRLHSHGSSLYEIHYFISGNGSFRDRSTVFRIEPGSLYITPPGSFHQISATNEQRPITYYALLFDAEDDPETQDLLEGLGQRRGAFSIGTAQRFFFADLLEKSRAERPELVKAAYHGLLAFLYALDSGLSAPHATTDNAHIEKALAIMQSSIEGNLELSAICRRLQLSREHFVRLFSEQMGMPPMRYYSHLKIEAAQAMLSSTNLHIQEIADKLGYVNQFNFTRAFSRIAGMSPSRYRVACLQRADFAIDGPGQTDAEPQAAGVGR